METYSLSCCVGVPTWMLLLYPSDIFLSNVKHYCSRVFRGYSTSNYGLKQAACSFMGAAGPIRAIIGRPGPVAPQVGEPRSVLWQSRGSIFRRWRTHAGQGTLCATGRSGPWPRIFFLRVQS